MEEDEELDQVSKVGVLATTGFYGRRSRSLTEVWASKEPLSEGDH